MRALQTRCQHAPGYGLSPEILLDHHLPDKQGIFPIGTDIGGNESANLLMILGNDRSWREMRAEQKIAVLRVQIQRGRIFDKPPYRLRVFFFRQAK